MPIAHCSLPIGGLNADLSSAQLKSADIWLADIYRMEGIDVDIAGWYRWKGTGMGTMGDWQEGKCAGLSPDAVGGHNNAMVWYGIVRYGVAWYDMLWHGNLPLVRYGLAWYDMLWYGKVWFGMVLYGLAWYDMVLVWYGIAW